ncbi:MAG: iron ABC transporter permease [Candidatus Sericytochromatia bacterium]
MSLDNLKKTNKGYFFYFILCSSLLLILTFLSIAKGSIDIPIQNILNFNLSEEEITIIRDIRLPRTIIAILIGSGLATSGMILQSVLKNSLADPFITGISGGASLGATIAIIFSLNIEFLGLNSIPLFSFLGSILCIYLSYKISSNYGYLNIERFMLSGVAISSLCSAIVSALLTLKGEDSNAVLAWIIGNISGKSWESIKIIFPYFIISNIICFFYINKLNILQLGDETAENLGVNINKTKILLIITASILSASIVSISGIIGFIGMIVPQVSRYLLKSSDYRLIYPFVLIIGAIILIISDLFSRLLIPPQEIPIGVFTSFIGVPFFIFLLMKNK